MAAEVIIGGDELVAALDKMIRSGLKTKPAMELIANTWRNKVKAQFIRGVDPYGRAWKPSREGQTGKDTGAMFNNILHESTDDEARTGTNTCYAIAFQNGATIRAGTPPHMSLCGSMTKGANLLRFKIGGRWVFAKQVKIPARPLFPSEALGGLPAEWQEDATDILLNHLQSGLK